VFARQFASRVFIIPTTVDTDLHIPKEGNSGRTIVGWTGSHSTLKYLEKIEPVLIELTTAFPKIEIMVIADRPPVFSKIQCTFHTWNAATEIEDLQNFDIGMVEGEMRLQGVAIHGARHSGGRLGGWRKHEDHSTRSQWLPCFF
jgi:hypothetical protein